MDSQTPKRIRTANYTNEEKHRLVEICRDYKAIIENKKTDSCTWKDKDEAWHKITADFNSSCPNGVFRSMESLRKCYENKKKEIRKILAEENKARIQTGGGAAYTPSQDPCTEIIKDIVSVKTMSGMENFDGDSVLVFVDEDDQCLEEQPSTSSFPETQYIQGNPVKRINWGNHSATDLKAPLPKVLRTDKLSEENGSWCQRRRPAAVKTLHTTELAKKYQEVADLKTKYILAEIEASSRKREREEEHALKIKSLHLDIAIKEAQLKQINQSI